MEFYGDKRRTKTSDSEIFPPTLVIIGALNDKLLCEMRAKQDTKRCRKMNLIKLSKHTWGDDEKWIDPPRVAEYVKFVVLFHLAKLRQFMHWSWHQDEWIFPMNLLVLTLGWVLYYTLLFIFFRVITRVFSAAFRVGIEMMKLCNCLKWVIRKPNCDCDDRWPRSELISPPRAKLRKSSWV